MTASPRLTVAAAPLVAGAAIVSSPVEVSTPGPLVHRTGPGESVATVRLIDSAAAGQLAERTAGTLRVEPDTGTALVAGRALDVATSTTVDSYRAGDVAYWAAGAEVVIFLADGSAVPPQGLIPLGQVSHGLDTLSSCASACLVRLDAAALSFERSGG